MVESFDSFQKLRPSKSMTFLPQSYIDTDIIKQIGNYKLGIELGSGAFGKVVLGKHIITGETVAIKILDKKILNKTPEDYDLVKKEMSILKLVKHKYIIQLYEILQTEKYIFIVMEYCEGKDFMDYIISKNNLPESEALKYFQQLINALFYLHSQNIAHRDIKIDNILLDHNKNLKLIDFGLSTKYQENKLLDQPCGTIVYSAPEVLEGKLYHGMLADIWSSGIVLYGMLCGYLPFSEENDSINKKNIIEGKYDIPDNISPSAKNLLKHILDINPVTRYTLKEIKDHPWFKMNKFILIQGIIFGYHKIPIDLDVLNLCEKFGYDKNKIKYSVINNKFDEGSALYYLLVKQRCKKGIYSVSDLFSDKFIKYIYNEKNLVENYKTILYNKRKNRNGNTIYTDINEKIKKTESDLSAAPGLVTGIISTPKKNKKFRILNVKQNFENEKNNEETSKNNIMKKNRKIKLYSSINKKSLSKIQKTNNFVSGLLEENNYITNTSNLCINKKIKNKIVKNQNNNENSRNKNKSRKNNSKEKHSPFNQTKFIIDNIHKMMKNSINKENINFNNKQLALKGITITSHSQIAKKVRNRIASNIKISSKSRNEQNNINKINISNYRTNLRQSKDYSTISKEKISKSIDTIEYNQKNKSKKKTNEKRNNNNFSIEYKNKKLLSKKNHKNISPLNKIIKNSINYLSNYISTTNSKEKRIIKSIKKPQIKIERNEGYSTNYTNYTKSSSHSSNAINKNKKRISTNVFNLCRKNNINNINNNKKLFNLKKNIENKQDNICDLILDNLDKNKNNKSSNIFLHNEEKKINNSNKNNYNNIQIIKINKLEKLKKSSKHLYFNNKILKGIKYRNQPQKINQSKTLYNNYHKGSNNNSNTTSFKKHKNKINYSSFNDKNIENIKKNKSRKNSEKISAIKVNQKSKKSWKNYSSSNKYKKRQRIKSNNEISNDKKNISRKKYFESTAITRRYHSPLFLKELSESQKSKYANKKIKINQMPMKIIKNSFDDKKDKNISNIKYIKKANKNSFTLNNHKIKGKIKYKKNKTPLKIITNININNQNISLLNKFKVNNKKNKNCMTHINTCYSKENIYYAPNLLYKLNSPKNQNMKNIYQDEQNQNRSINLLKQYPLINSLKSKFHNNSNKKICHRNINHFNISNINNANFTNNNYFSNFSISTSLSMNSIAIIKDKVKINDNSINQTTPLILDLSCLTFGKKDLNECCIDLINKFKNHGFDYVQKNMNVFDFYKNEEYCQIEIIQLFWQNNYNYITNNQTNIEKDINNKPLYYFKIVKRKGNNNLQKIFSDIFFSFN